MLFVVVVFLVLFLSIRISSTHFNKHIRGTFLTIQTKIAGYWGRHFSCLTKERLFSWEDRTGRFLCNRLLLAYSQGTSRTGSHAQRQFFFDYDERQPFIRMASSLYRKYGDIAKDALTRERKYEFKISIWFLKEVILFELQILWLACF